MCNIINKLKLYILNLPDNYIFVSKEEIKPEEVLEVRKSTGWGAGDDEDAWRSNITDCIVAVGIRNPDGLLIGMGFIVGNKRHAVLCDFNVRPEYQGKGFGTTILEERMRIIDELKIPFTYTSLSDENPLVEKYKTFGFKSDNGGYFRNNAANI